MSMSFAATQADFSNLTRLIDGGFKEYLLGQYYASQDDAIRMHGDFKRMIAQAMASISGKHARAAFGEPTQEEEDLYFYSRFRLDHSIADPVPVKDWQADILWHWHQYAAHIPRSIRRHFNRDERQALRQLNDLGCTAARLHRHPDIIGQADTVIRPVLPGHAHGPKIAMPYEHKPARLRAFFASFGTSLLLSGVSRYAVMAALGTVGAPAFAVTVAAAATAGVAVGAFTHYRKNREDIERMAQHENTLAGRMTARWRGLRKSWGWRQAFVNAATGAAGGVLGFELSGYLAEHNVVDSLQRHFADRAAPLGEMLQPAADYAAGALENLQDRIAPMVEQAQQASFIESKPPTQAVTTAVVEAPVQTNPPPALSPAFDAASIDQVFAQRVPDSAPPITYGFVQDHETIVLGRGHDLQDVIETQYGVQAGSPDYARAEAAVVKASGLEGVDLNRLGPDTELTLPLSALAEDPAPVEAAPAIEPAAQVAAIEPEAAAAPAREAYQVESGDHLWKMTRDEFGYKPENGPGRWAVIEMMVAANPHLAADPTALTVGEQLVVPDFNDPNTPKADCSAFIKKQARGCVLPTLS